WSKRVRTIRRSGESLQLRVVVSEAKHVSIVIRSCGGVQRGGPIDVTSTEGRSVLGGTILGTASLGGTSMANCRAFSAAAAVATSCSGGSPFSVHVAGGHVRPASRL